MAVDDAIELARRSIYHATFRDAVSGGTVSGTFCIMLNKIIHFPDCSTSTLFGSCMLAAFAFDRLPSALILVSLCSVSYDREWLEEGNRS